MSRFFKTVGREFASATPFVRNKYFEWEFLRRKQSYKGVFTTFEAAVAHATSGRLAGYNHQELARDQQPSLHDLNSADYPVLFWLSSLLANARSVFDLGGNLGVAFYAYRRYLSFPADLRWTVCELPGTVAAGRELAREGGVTQLGFTEQRETAEGAEIYFTAGALQYIDEPFSRILGKLHAKPAHVIVQRVPLCDGPSFITLQNNGNFITPYQVANVKAFLQSITELGYEVVDHWRVNRSLQVLDSPEHRADYYHGAYFRLR